MIESDCHSTKRRWALSILIVCGAVAMGLAAPLVVLSQDGMVRSPGPTAPAHSPGIIPFHEPSTQLVTFHEAERLYTEEEVRAIVREELALQQQEMSPAGYVVGADLGLSASWNHGLEFTTPGRDFRVHVGGRTQFDGVWLTADDPVRFGAGGVGELGDAANFRRARLRVDGVMYEVVEWAAEYDFVNQANVNPGTPGTNGNTINVPALTDLWVGITHLPAVGNLRIGNFKEPIGLEHLTSSRWLDFLERSFLQDAFFGPFNNGFSPGVMLFNWGPQERATWAIGAFKNTSNIFGSGLGDGEYAVTGRVTALPWYEADGRYLLHLGVAGSHRDLDDGGIRIRSRASLRSANPGPLNPILADSGTFLGDGQSLLAGEALLIHGPWQLQSEYVASFVQNSVVGGAAAGEVFYHGWYCEVAWFLTGEHRPYNRRTGIVDRIIPGENYFFVPGDSGPLWGSGAWQVAARYSMLDLRDPALDGGILQDVTLGLNWFLNPNMKMQWNYVYTHRDAPGATSDGVIHGAGMRVAYDF